MSPCNVECDVALCMQTFPCQSIYAFGVPQVWNPCFDVTPADLITGIITERGPVSKSASGSFQVADMLHHQDEAATPDHNQNGASSPAANGAHAQQQANGSAEHKAAGSDIPEGFVALDVDTVKDYLAGIPHLASRLGPKESSAQWQVHSSLPSCNVASTKCIS